MAICKWCERRIIGVKICIDSNLGLYDHPKCNEERQKNWEKNGYKNLQKTLTGFKQ